MANKVILTAAVTGAVHIPSMSPYLPDTPDKIIDCLLYTSRCV